MANLTPDEIEKKYRGGGKIPPPLYCKEGDYKDQIKKKILESADSKHFERRRMEKAQHYFNMLRLFLKFVKFTLL